MNVVVNGLMASYQKAGKGPAIVFLHGWGDSAATYTKLIAELSGYTIYALDLPGFGGSQRPDRAWGLSDYAGFVHDWLEKTGVGKPYSLCGHSFGGAIAIAGTASGTLQPSKLILLASAGVRGKRPLRKKALRLASNAGRIPLYLLPPSKAQKIKLRFYSRIGSDLMLVPQMRETFVRTVKEDVRADAASIKQPTLLIYGRRDQETPASDGRVLHEAIAGSRLELVDAGHFLHQEQSEQVAGLIKDFLNGKDRRDK